MNEYQPRKQCSRCKIRESNMYSFGNINLCNDCASTCLSHLLLDQNILITLQKYINENNKKTI